MSRKIAVGAILLVLVFPVFALAQESQSERPERAEEVTEARVTATFTTMDTLDPKDFAKPADVSRADGAKKLGAVKKFIELATAPERVARAEVIGTIEQSAPARFSIAGSPASTGNAQLDALVTAAATKYGLDQRLIIAVMRQESSFNPRAVSPKGARGLMQLMPATARRFGVQDILDPAQNIDGGAQYLRFLLDTFQGDVELALAGYNAGEHAVIRYGHRIPPYRETIDYVQRIGAHYHRLRQGAGLAAPTSQAQALAERRSEPELIGGRRTLSQY